VFIVREHPEFLERNQVIVRLRQEFGYSLNALASIARHVFQTPACSKRLSIFRDRAKRLTNQQLRVNTRRRSSKSECDMVVGGRRKKVRSAQRDLSVATVVVPGFINISVRTSTVRFLCSLQAFIQRRALCLCASGCKDNTTPPVYARSLQ
jgi:hypothetical protein